MAAPTAPNPFDPETQPVEFTVYATTGQPWLNPQDHQRVGFTAGPTVRLNDGQLWHLPILDAGLLLTTPELILRVNQSYDLAAQIHADPSAVECRVAYAETLKTIGMTLLMKNYQLGSEDLFAEDYQPTRDGSLLGWVTLMTFVDLNALIALRDDIACAIVDAEPLWWPYLAVPGATN